MQVDDLENLIQRLAKLPGLGPRSGRRAALHLLKKRDDILKPLIQALQTASDNLKDCETCGNLDTSSPCLICQDPKRRPDVLCVVEEVADLWAMERSHSHAGGYHILGGTLSAMDGIGPDNLRISSLVQRVAEGNVSEVVLALNPTVEGQSTAHYVMDQLAHSSVHVTALAQGIPLGGELDYLDDGTLLTAMQARRKVA